MVARGRACPVPLVWTNGRTGAPTNRPGEFAKTQFRGLFVSEFAEWMDRTLAEVEPDSPVDTFARALVDAEQGRAVQASP